MTMNQTLASIVAVVDKAAKGEGVTLPGWLIGSTGDRVDPPRLIVTQPEQTMQEMMSGSPGWVTSAYILCIGSTTDEASSLASLIAKYISRARLTVPLVDDQGNDTGHFRKLDAVYTREMQSDSVSSYGFSVYIEWTELRPYARPTGTILHGVSSRADDN